MRLPKTVQIGDATWQIKRRWRLPNIGPGEGPMMGYCDPNIETIFIRRNISDAELIATFVHELMHALEWEYDVKIPHKLIYDLDDPIANLIIENFLSG